MYTDLDMESDGTNTPPPDFLLEARNNRNNPVYRYKFLNDAFFKKLYIFYRKAGLWPIMLSQICYLLTVLFSLLFTTFITICVDWKSIHNGSKKDLSSAIYPNCYPEGGRNPFLVFSLIIFLVWWFIIVIQSINYLRDMIEVSKLWKEHLGPLEFTCSWDSVVEKIRQKLELPFVDPFHVANRIMRWDNYLIDFVMKVIALGRIGFGGKLNHTRYRILSLIIGGFKKIEHC